MTEKEYLTAVCSFEGFGPIRTKFLLKHFKSSKKIWESRDTELIKVGLPQNLVRKFASFRNKFDIQEYFKKLSKLSIKAVAISEKSYPQNLKSLQDAPLVLYVRGTIKKADNISVAIVGSRLMSEYGKKVTNRFATQLAKEKITVISGLALGVDAEAHRSACSAGGRTIAVLASGLDMITPLTNKNLALAFIKKNGALVSEYPLGHIPKPSDFAIRNRLISGLARVILVTEARFKSGTFYTVKAALDQGKEVFSVPGPITSPASEGTNYLIENGARVAMNADEIIEAVKT